MTLRGWFKVWQAEREQEEAAARERRKTELAELKTGMAKQEREIRELGAIQRERERREVAVRELQQTDPQAYIAALYARKAELEQKIGGADWLCYLPHTAEPPEIIGRAQTYMEAMRLRLEAEGCRMWLDYNHDCQTRMFEISEFREMHGSVFCRGNWTALARKYLNLYRGVSPDGTVFMGDFDLCTSMSRPAGCRTLADLPVAAQAAAQSPQVRGLAGAAVMEDHTPVNGVTGIYRLTNKRMIEATPLSP